MNAAFHFGTVLKNCFHSPLSEGKNCFSGVGPLVQTHPHMGVLQRVDILLKCFNASDHKRVTPRNRTSVKHIHMFPCFVFSVNLCEWLDSNQHYRGWAYLLSSPWITRLLSHSHLPDWYRFIPTGFAIPFAFLGTSKRVTSFKTGQSAAHKPRAKV